ncbi:phosphoribosylanthranilate isomerase [Paenibacillus senegalensis]|uniref:phosphoribosylanthranilate isomerase n=1 Tax=Paenibacillus senegalensis TaxID=1465766 RepID=UPI000288E6BC|nr:phosphoribosylanthranilate isomerase [Paenibacillus senegalensis]
MTGNAPTAIKICGLQTEQVIRDIQSLPITYIGLVFAPSRRQVTAQQAAKLIRAVKESPEPLRPKAAGVFVNPTLELLEQTMEEAQLDVIQLHGQESPAFCTQVQQRFGVDIFKAISFSAASACSASEPVRPAAWQVAEYGNSVSALLLDTHDPVHGGGSGKTFSWEVIPEFYEQAHQAGMKLFIAGGLNPENVSRLLDTYDLDGVDISSGVETDGVKDVNKIKQFVRRVIGL